MKSAVHKKLYTSHPYYFDDWSWSGSRLESQILVVVSISVNTLPPSAERFFLQKRTVLAHRTVRKESARAS